MKKVEKYSMNDTDELLKVMTSIYKDKTAQWDYEEVYDEVDTYKSEAKKATKDAKALEGMLLRLMKHLRATGEDVFVVLKDNELQSWWQAKLADILKEEAKQAAMEKAMAALSEEERKALGLKF